MAESSAATVGNTKLVNLVCEEAEEDLPQRVGLMAGINTIGICQDSLEEDWRMRVAGGKATPLGNTVVQEVWQDSVTAAAGRTAPGDHILEASTSAV